MRLLSRKFLLALTLGGGNMILMAQGLISDTVYAAIASAVITGYLTANVVQKRQE